METERVFLLLAACASSAWARGKGGAGTGGGGNSWRGGGFCSLMLVVGVTAGIYAWMLVIGVVGEFFTLNLCTFCGYAYLCHQQLSL